MPGEMKPLFFSFIETMFTRLKARKQLQVILKLKEIIGKNTSTGKVFKERKIQETKYI